MANALRDSKRSDKYSVNPFDVVMREELRGRFEPPTEEEIIDLATSIYEETQLEPCGVRRLPDGNSLLTFGYTRCAAVRLIREGFYAPDGQFIQDAEFMLEVIIKNENDETTFRRNIVENRKRVATSAIDDAHNQEKLRTRYGWSNADIAKFYRMTSQQVSDREKLLGLEKEHQALVHKGLLSITAALDALELPAETRDEVIKKATAEGGKVQSGEVRKQLRDHHLRDKDDAGASGGSSTSGGGAPTGGGSATATRARNTKEIREFWEAEARMGGKAAKFAEQMVAYAKGEISDATLKEALDKLVK